MSAAKIQEEDWDLSTPLGYVSPSVKGGKAFSDLDTVGILPETPEYLLQAQAGNIFVLPFLESQSNCWF